MTVRAPKYPTAKRRVSRILKPLKIGQPVLSALRCRFGFFGLADVADDSSRQNGSTLFSPPHQQSQRADASESAGIWMHCRPWLELRPALGSTCSSTGA